jgi:hypothetical protein
MDICIYKVDKFKKEKQLINNLIKLIANLKGENKIIN